nr:MAG TPA: hypothetical protein [Bacteriophage sp.]
MELSSPWFNRTDLRTSTVLTGMGARLAYQPA